MTCPHFPACGGCTGLDIPYADQLRRKRARLVQWLTPALGSRGPGIEPVAPSPVTTSSADDGEHPRGFRQKVAFAFGEGPDGRGLVMGHYAAGSNRIIPVTTCPVHNARGNRVAFAVRDALTRARIPAAGPQFAGLVRHLVVRTTADERQAVAMLVVTRNDKRLRAPVRAAMNGPDAPDGFVINVHDRPGPLMVGRESLVVAGRGQVRETALGPAFLVSPTAFFQTNVAAARVLLDEVMTAAPARTGLRVLDLYSGSGLFGLPLARAGHAVTMVEENAQALADAEANLATNRMDGARVRLICARAEDAVSEMPRRSPVLREIDYAVVDPPRDGCPPTVIAAVFGRLRPARVTYVSCNPEALATELPAILREGYAPTRIQPVDMFPHTDHLETVMVLDRR